MTEGKHNFGGIPDLHNFVNQGKIIGSGFSNPVLSQNSRFPNPVYFPFTGYHKSGNNTLIIQPSSRTNFLIYKIKDCFPRIPWRYKAYGMTGNNRQKCNFLEQFLKKQM